MKWILTLLLLIISLSSYSQVLDQTLPEKIEETVEIVEEQVKNTSFHRNSSKGSLLVGYELLSTWVPFKFTGSYTHIFNKTWSIEAEVARGHFGVGYFGVDLASLSEYRYSLLARRYSGNSFHWIFGLYKDDFKAKLGNDILEGMADTSIDDLKVVLIGATLGLGNRWQWKNGLTLGMDWVRINLPVFDRRTDQGVLRNISDNSERDSVKQGIDRVAKVPSFTLLGLYLGYTF